MVTFAAPTEAGPRLPAGEYIMRLKDIEEAEASTFNPDTQRLKFILTVGSVEAIDQYPDDIDEDDEDALEAFDQSLVGKDHWEWCNNKMGGNSTLRKWLTGMLGRTIEKSDSLDPSQFVGKDYKVQLGIENYVIQQTGQAGEKFTIKTIKPYREPRRRSTRETLAANTAARAQVAVAAAQKGVPNPLDGPEGFDPNTVQYDENGNLLPF